MNLILIGDLVKGWMDIHGSELRSGLASMLSISPTVSTLTGRSFNSTAYPWLQFRHSMLCRGSQ